MNRRTWSEAELRKAVVSSTSYRQVLAKLGLREAGGNYAQLQRYVAELGLDTAHFKGRTWNKGLKIAGVPRIPLERVLVKGSTFQSHKLKMRLFAAKLKPMRCEECGWAKVSSDGRLPLELDHINGDPRDNRLQNLRILCPNCHSLKPTHRGRNSVKNARVL